VKGRTLLLPALAAAATLAFSSQPAPEARHAASIMPPGDSTRVPLRTVLFSGHRYIVDADFGLGRHVPLMVHGNSRLFLSVTHAVGERIAGGPVTRVEEYGYSARGKGFLTVPAMRVGGRTFADLHDVPVFDFTEEGDTLVQGMLGVPFLVSAGAIVDFTSDVMILGATPTEEPARDLLDAGYTATKLTIEADDRVTLRAHFPSLGRAVAITPSTVSSALTLHRPLFAGNVPMRKADSPDQSPSRTSPDVYLSDQVAFEIEGVGFHAPASFEDFAEYGAVPEAELESFGILGYDWMKEHHAIIDYAGRRLYFKP